MSHLNSVRRFEIIGSTSIKSSLHVDTSIRMYFLVSLPRVLLCLALDSFMRRIFYETAGSHELTPSDDVFLEFFIIQKCTTAENYR